MYNWKNWNLAKRMMIFLDILKKKKRILKKNRFQIDILTEKKIDFKLAKGNGNKTVVWNTLYFKCKIVDTTNILTIISCIIIFTYFKLLLIARVYRAKIDYKTEPSNL